MKIILANPRGFCAGVNMAIDSLERALELFGTPLYVYHEIVHNRHVVDRFSRRGVVFVDHIEDIPSGAHVLYSAHGVAPAIRQAAQERNLHAIDATCPLVTKVHLEAVRFAREGYTILLIGHEGHDEVLGTIGEAPASIRLVQDAQEVEALDLPPDAKVAYLTQTTLSVDDAEIVIAALRNASRRSSARRVTTSATRRRTARKPSRIWSPRPTWSSSWAARIARTACASPNWPRSGQARLSHRRGPRIAARMARRRRPRADHRGRQRPGGCRRGVRRVSGEAIRRDRREPHDSRGAREFPVAEGAAAADGGGVASSRLRVSGSPRRR